MKGIIMHQPQHHRDISKLIDKVYGIMFDLDEILRVERREIVTDKGLFYCNNISTPQQVSCDTSTRVTGQWHSCHHVDTNSRKVTNTDNLGAKIDTAKIPNGWKILFERISNTLSISTNMSSITSITWTNSWGNKFARGQIRERTILTAKGLRFVRQKSIPNGWKICL